MSGAERTRRYRQRVKAGRVGRWISFNEKDVADFLVLAERMTPEECKDPMMIVQKLEEYLWDMTEPE